MFRSLLMVVMGAIGCFFCSVLAAEEVSVGQTPPPTAEELFYKLSSTVQQLRTVRMHAVDRFENRAADGSLAVGVRWHDIFLNGDSIQVRTVSKNEDDAGWRAEKQSYRHPITKVSLKTYDGNICCYRPEGETTLADIQNIPNSMNRPYTVLYAAYTSPHPVNDFALPFLAVGRLWNPPGSRTYMGAPLLDSILTSDYRLWANVERDQSQEYPTISVAIPVTPAPAISPLHRRSGVLKIWPGLKVWFTDDANNFPIRVERYNRYFFDDQQMDVVSSVAGTTGLILKTGKYKHFGNGIWYPETGLEVRYVSDPNVAAVTETADDVVDEYLREGRYQVKGAPIPGLTREWKVLELEELPATTELWIEPPDGALVNNVDTHVEHIVGMTAEETEKVLGYAGHGARDAEPIKIPNGRSYLLWINAIIAICVVIYFIRNYRRLN